MTNLFTELLKFFGEFNLKKFFATVVMTLIALALFSIYEFYTSSFRFSRLQKAADLLHRIDEIELQGTNTSPELQRARKTIVTQAVEAIVTKPFTLEIIPSTLKFSMDGVWKFMAGAALWLFFALFQIGGLTDPKKRSTFFGLVTVAIITGFMGMFVANYWWPWFHIFIFPWVALLCIGVALLPFGYFVTKRAAKKIQTQG